MFNLKIETANDDFADAPERTVAAILRGIADQLDGGKMADTIRDPNGNTVGSWKLDTPEEEAARCDAIDQARSIYIYQDDQIQIDSDAQMSEADGGGAWVQAWVWIDDPEIEDDDADTGTEQAEA